MLELKMISFTEGYGGRVLETTGLGYINPADVSALLPLRSREIDGEWTPLTEVQLRNGKTIVVIGYPPEIETIFKGALRPGLEDEIESIIAEFEHDPVACLQIIGEHIELARHYRAHPNAPKEG